MNPWIAIVGLLAVMSIGVVGTMVVENWRRLVEPAPISVGRPTAAGAAGNQVDQRQPAAQPTSSAPAEPAEPAEPEQLSHTIPIGPPEAARPEGAALVDGSVISIRDRETADILAGVLFAAYATSGRSGADRAAAWVTATATPPGADPVLFAPGVRLRGKTSRVAALLDRDDLGVVWVGLQHAVDIRRGLARTPVTQPTLLGLVTWWQLTDELPSTVPPDDAGLVAEAISAVTTQLSQTTWADVVDSIRTALARASATSSDVTVALTGSSVPAGPAGRTGAEHEARERGRVSVGPIPAGLPS